MGCLHSRDKIVNLEESWTWGGYLAITTSIDFGTFFIRPAGGSFTEVYKFLETPNPTITLTLPLDWATSFGPSIPNPNLIAGGGLSSSYNFTTRLSPMPDGDFWQVAPNIEISLFFVGYRSDYQGPLDFDNGTAFSAWHSARSRYESRSTGFPFELDRNELDHGFSLRNTIVYNQRTYPLQCQTGDNINPYNGLTLIPSGTTQSFAGTTLPPISPAVAGGSYVSSADVHRRALLAFSGRDIGHFWDSTLKPYLEGVATPSDPVFLWSDWTNGAGNTRTLSVSAKNDSLVTPSVEAFELYEILRDYLSGQESKMEEVDPATGVLLTQDKALRGGLNYTGFTNINVDYSSAQLSRLAESAEGEVDHNPGEYLLGDLNRLHGQLQKISDWKT